MYFNHHTITPELGLREAINKILMSDVVTGDGIAKESNYAEVESWRLDSLVPARTQWYMAGYGSTGDTFELAEKVSGKDMKEIIDAIEWLVESPVLSETRYSDMIYERACEQLTQLAEEYEVEAQKFIDNYFDTCDNYPYEDNGDVYIDLSQESLDAIVEQTERDAQTWETHHSSGKYHTPKFCSYCAEFPQLVGER